MYMKFKSNRVDCDDEYYFGFYKMMFVILGGLSLKYFGLMLEDMVMDGIVKKVEMYFIIFYYLV